MPRRSRARPVARVSLSQFLAIATQVTGRSTAELVHGGHCVLGRATKALLSPHVSHDGRDVHPKLFDKAAAHCGWILSARPLTEGNELAAYVTMVQFAALNGLVWEHGPAGEAGSASAIRDLVSGDLPDHYFPPWVKERLR